MTNSTQGMATLLPNARYRALGNSVAIPCVEFVMRGVSTAVLYWLSG